MFQHFYVPFVPRFREKTKKILTENRTFEEPIQAGLLALSLSNFSIAATAMRLTAVSSDTAA